MMEFLVEDVEKLSGYDIMESSFIPIHDEKGFVDLVSLAANMRRAKIENPDFSFGTVLDEIEERNNKAVDEFRRVPIPPKDTNLHVNLPSMADMDARQVSFMTLYFVSKY